MNDAMDARRALVIGELGVDSLASIYGRAFSSLGYD